MRDIKIFTIVITSVLILCAFCLNVSLVGFCQTPTQPPGPPTNLTADVQGGMVYLSWDEPGSDGGAPIDGYHLYRGVTSWDKTKIEQIKFATDYTDNPPLDLGNIFYYHVTANNINGESPQSNDVMVEIASGGNGSNGDNSDTGVIDGYVYDSDTRDPVASAYISFQPQFDGEGQDTTSEASGFYSLTLERGMYSISVSAPGYEELFDSCEIYQEKDVRDFLLSPTEEDGPPDEKGDDYPDGDKNGNGDGNGDDDNGNGDGGGGGNPMENLQMPAELGMFMYICVIIIFIIVFSLIAIVCILGGIFSRIGKLTKSVKSAQEVYAAQAQSQQYYYGDDYYEQAPRRPPHRQRR